HPRAREHHRSKVVAPHGTRSLRARRAHRAPAFQPDLSDERAPHAPDLVPRNEPGRFAHPPARAQAPRRGQSADAPVVLRFFPARAGGRALLETAHRQLRADGHRRVRARREAGRGQAMSAAPDLGNAHVATPFKFLDYFDETPADVRKFAGREAEISEITDA